MSVNPYSDYMARKYQNRSNGRTSTSMYECRIIDVHPESLTCDVIITQSSKTILGVKLSSSLFGKNLSEIIIPDIGSAAILAAMSDDTDPFIIAYKQHYSDGKDGFLPNSMLNGEKANILSNHSFEKNDRRGNFIKANGDGDGIQSSRNKFSISSKNTEIKTFNNVLSSTYEAGKISSDDVQEIISDTVGLRELIGSDSVFEALKVIHKMSFDDDNRLELLNNIKGYIEAFLNVADVSKFDFTSKTLLKERVPIDKEMYFSPVSMEEQEILDEQGAKIGSRFIETDKNNYSLIIDMLDETPNIFLYKLYNDKAELVKTKTVYLDYEKDDIKYDVYSEESDND